MKNLLEKQDFPEHWTVPSAIHLQVLQLSPLSNTSPLIYPSPRYTQSVKKDTDLEFTFIKSLICLALY